MGTDWTAVVANILVVIIAVAAGTTWMVSRITKLTEKVSSLERKAMRLFELWDTRKCDEHSVAINALRQRIETLEAHGVRH